MKHKGELELDLEIAEIAGKDKNGEVANDELVHLRAYKKDQDNTGNTTEEEN